MPTCPACGGNVPADGELCKFCGTRPPVVAGETTGEKPEGGPSAPETQVLALLRQGRKIEAIKVFRAATNCGLKEAKDAVEALAAQHGIVARRAGCASTILFLVLAAALCIAALA
jgi:hypothetical protein